MNAERANLSDVISEIMGQLIEKYDLTPVHYDDEEAYLMGGNFGLRFFAAREGVDMTYIAPNGKGGWSVYYPLALLETRFRAEDRLKYGHPQGRAGRMAGSIRIYASAIAREFDDVLRGDQRWLNRERDYLRELDQARCLKISNAMVRDID